MVVLVVGGNIIILYLGTQDATLTWNEIMASYSNNIRFYYNHLYMNISYFDKHAKDILI